MFVAMALVLVVNYVEYLWSTSRRKKQQRDYEELTDPNDARPSQLKSFGMVGIPALLDQFGSGITMCGLVYIEASVWQIMRGS